MTYPNIKEQLFRETEEHNTKTVNYIMNGSASDPDEGIKRYATSIRWNQYKAGTITREKVIDCTINRFRKTSEKRTTKELEKIASVENISEVIAIDIAVEFRKSRTWGRNPYVVASVSWKDTENNYHHGKFYGSASGCGYDKESAAVASALNESPAALKILFDLKEDNSAFHYGIGNSAIPYFMGGVGMGCFRNIAMYYGMRTTENTRPAYESFYTWEL